MCYSSNRKQIYSKGVGRGKGGREGKTFNSYLKEGLQSRLSTECQLSSRNWGRPHWGPGQDTWKRWHHLVVPLPMAQETQSRQTHPTDSTSDTFLLPLEKYCFLWVQWCCLKAQTIFNKLIGLIRIEINFMHSSPGSVLLWLEGESWEAHCVRNTERCCEYLYVKRC